MRKEMLRACSAAPSSRVTASTACTGVASSAAASTRDSDTSTMGSMSAHRSAEDSPNAGTTARLHALGDQVTAQA